jgi:outer membrane cobalamin receptor
MRARLAVKGAALLSLTAIAGCGLKLRGAGSSMDAAPGPLTINAATIEKSGAATAWEALQRTVRFYIFHSNGRIEHRGRSSIVLADQPLIMLDGITLTDVTFLNGIPAADIAMIEVLDALDATTRYGTNAGQGVIRLWTKAGS